MCAMHGGISVVVTVWNDREGLAALLDALAGQERVPDEVVVVDAGSTDGTDAMLAARPEPVTVVAAPGANISAGRNIGIRAARFERIACTDAGCTPRPGWLAALDFALTGDVEFVAGVYRVVGETAFERCLATALYPSPEEIGVDDPVVKVAHKLFGRSFDVEHATGRSMAFTRRAWELAGGFPEHLFAGEDVAFSAAAAAAVPSALVPAAEVTWRPRPTWAANARMYAVYARGDVRQGSPNRHLARAGAYLGGAAAMLRGGPAVRALALAGAAAYLGLPARRARADGLPPADWWRLPLVVAMKDLSQVTGAVQGLADAAAGRPQPRPGR